MTADSSAPLVSMTKERRTLLLRIWAGYRPVHDVTMPLYHLDTHFPQAAVDDALRALIRSGLTGAYFVAWFREDCKNSYLEMHRKLVSMLEKMPERSMFAGKDGFSK